MKCANSCSDCFPFTKIVQSEQELAYIPSIKHYSKFADFKYRSTDGRFTPYAIVVFQTILPTYRSMLVVVKCKEPLFLVRRRLG